MAKKQTTRVEIWGIKFDAMVDQTTTLASTVPEYVTEKGFIVSDNVVNDPEKISMTLVVSDMPMNEDDGYEGRSKDIVDKIRDEWAKKKTTTIITAERVYKDMVITDFTIKKSKDLGNSREISVSAQKVRITNKKTAKVPKYVKKKGTTKKKHGKAGTSPTSNKSNASSPSTTNKSSSSKTKNSSGSNKNAAKKKNQTAAKSIANAWLGKENYNKLVKGK